MEQFIRTELLLGKAGMEKLKNSRVIVFGIGGVGGHCAEALIRSGIGAIDIVDNDVIAESNINRQIIATYSNIGRYKTEVMKERLLDINPEADVKEFRCFFLPENAELFSFEKYDYVIDAVDTVAAKLAIVTAADAAGVPVISCMGAGNKLHPELFEIADIYKTSVCPLAKVMRHELKKRGIKKLKCVYSKEEPVNPSGDIENEEINAENLKSSGRPAPGSIAFTPSVAGLIMAGEVIRDIVDCNPEYIGTSSKNTESDGGMSEERMSGDSLQGKDSVTATDKKIESVTAYVDGSYNVATGEYAYGAVIFCDEEKKEFSEKFDDPELATMRNVAGELEGAMKAMRYAVEVGAKELDIYYDYEGIEKWCTGAWKTNKDGTKAYKAFYDSLFGRLTVHFHKVKGHSGDRYNDEADKLAKAALGI